MAQWIIPDYFPIEGVVFDMDGLMIDTERIIKYSWDVMGEKMGYSRFGDNIFQTLGLSRVQRNEYFLKKYGDDFPLQEFLDGYHQVYAEYERQYGIPKKTGLLELLEYLKNHGVPMAVATSTHQEHSVPELEKQGILPYFKEIVTGDMVNAGKPDPEIYRTACDRMGVDPSATVALEDSYNGIRSAYRAGMKVIMIPDLLEEDAPIKEFLYGKMESLQKVQEWMERGENKI